MSNPDPTQRPGGFQGPGDAEPQPIIPYVLAEDEMAAWFRLDQDEAGFLRRARRRRLLVRVGIALVGLIMAAAVLWSVAAIQGGQPSTPTTVPVPVIVPAPVTGPVNTASEYVPCPATGDPCPADPIRPTTPERRHAP